MFSTIFRGSGKAWLLSLALLTGAIPAAAQENAWAGKTVLIKPRFVPLADDAGKVLGTFVDADCLVLLEKNGRIKVATRQGDEGWIAKGHAVLLDEAVDFFTRRIQQNPADADAYHSRATAWELKGELDLAIKDLSEVIRIDPTDADSYNNRGTTLASKKDYDRAIQDFNEAVRLDPTSALYFTNRGAAFRDKRDFERAFKDFDEAVRLNPRDAMAYLHRGVARLDKKEHGQAIKDFDEAVRLNPKYADNYTFRAYAFYKTKDLDRAVQDLKESVRLNPRSDAALAVRGKVLAAQKDYARAQKDFEEAIRLQPRDLQTRSWLAWLLATCPDDGIRDGRKAVELARKVVDAARENDRDYGEFCDTLAAAYAEAGQFTDAVRWQQRALADPHFARTEGDAAFRRLELYRERKPFRE